MKLLPKLVISGIVAVGMAMGSTGYFVISSINTDMTLRLSNRLAGDAHFAAARIIDKRNQISAITKIVAQVREIRKALVLFESRGVSQILNDQIAVYPFINYILVTELDGTVFAASTGDGDRKRLEGEQLLSRQVKENPMFTLGNEGGLRIGVVGEDPFLPIIGLKKEYSQWYSMGIRKKGETIGRVILSVDWSGIHEQLLNSIFKELLQTGNPIDSVFITALDNNILCRNTDVESDVILPSLLNEQFVSTDRQLTDKKILTLGGYDYIVIVAYNRYSALKPIADAKRFVIGATFIGSFFLGVLIFLLIRKTILSRLSILNDATKKIGLGDLTYQIEHLGSDEIGSLGGAINKMVSNLDVKTTSVEELNAEMTLKNQALVELEEQRVIAEDSAKAKSEFLASMSHEIRTPMNGVLGMLGLLEKTKLTKRQVQQVGLAQTSAKSLLAIINDILDFSKIEAGKLDLEEVDFNVQELLEEFSKSQALRANQKGLELILDTRKIMHSMVLGDPDRLRQVLNNLVGNALKFTSEGEIVITGSLQESDASEVIFTCSVKDTGIGIEKDKQAQLFDAFTQADSTTTRKYGGTGLGLSITKQLCELMNGGVRISSEIDRGSLFEFFVVFKKSNMAINEYPHGDFGNLKILIVDDNVTNREVLKGQLNQWGVIADETSVASHALEVISRNIDDPFDIVFVDMGISSSDGVELAECIRKNPRFDSLKIVMMCPISHEDDGGVFSDIGIQASFSKPIVAGDLHQALSSTDTRNVKRKVAPDNGELLKAKGGFQGIRVLLVEDNVINQEVAKGILEDFGFSICIADNGREALNILNTVTKEDRFQIILMDCQMPLMDGYEATVAIRNGQAGKVYQEIPIVAMTANAMKGDKEKCIDAGMSSYVSKPINVGKLNNVLKLHLTGTTSFFEGSDLSPHLEEKRIWDRERYFEIIGNNERAEKIISMFVGSISLEIEHLSEAVISRDRYEISRIAHYIKGSTTNIYGEQISKYLSELEQSALNDDASCFDDLMKKIKVASFFLIDELGGS